MVFTCSLPNCRSRNQKVPKDPEIRRKWCQVLDRINLVIVSDRKERAKFRLCDIHFDNDSKIVVNKNRSNLKFNAVPTLHLYGITDKSSDKGSHYNVDATVCQPSTSTAAEAELPLTEPLTTVKNPSPTVGNLLRSKLLHSVGVRRAKDLTPKAKKLYKFASDLKKITRRLEFQNTSNKERLREAQEMAMSMDFLKTKLNSNSLHFITCQLKMATKKARGRRFSLDEKIFALSLLKQGPKAYKVLRRTFALPSRKTLMSLLNKIPFSTGINKKIMDVLEISVEKMDVLDRQCALLFDEISLEPSLTYDKKWDNIVGLQDIAQRKSLKFPDHALVFMVEGLRKKWKQPISFHFSQGGCNAVTLKSLINTTILALQEIGLNIVCTVCDQYSANVNAIKKLKEESERPSGRDIDIFEVGSQDIVAIYDPPHLLKGIRNKLLIDKVQYTKDGVTWEADWNHIIKLYELDEGDFNTRMCYKLTDSHIYKEKIKKMKVKNAAQVFSHRVSTTMRWTIKHGRDGIFPKSAEGTANFISFMDQVFDSINGSTYDADHEKERGAVKEGSKHLSFWEESIKIFKSMKFITSKGERVPPSITNWIKTLRGFIYIWRKLQAIGFKYLCPRRINQDPIENFFGCIRAHGVRNVNPTCYSFISSFKTLIINNFSSPHSSGANCEKDDNNVLNSLKSLLNLEETVEGSENVSEDNLTFQFSSVEDAAIISTHAYIVGYIAKQIKNKIGGCNKCINQLQASSFLQEHSFVEQLEYKPGFLIKTKTQFRRVFSNMTQLFLFLIPKYILQYNIKKKLANMFKKQIYNPFLCENHDLFQIYIELFLTFFIFAYLKNINSILRGNKDCNLKDKDPLKSLARQRFLTLKGKNKKIASVKKLT